ncbi:response regulator transcription factor [Rhodococcus sp. HNM0563]|uniref:response regulator n=1 Tax=unclassified Rhodococcus (in: high G+C Gram-positive bacteria) TaxID=192944 RepID=UPI00146C7295|nr:MULTISPECIES: response regulator transcription factor [unclassified Rhodococcus (in: high G+C Gram-positive bacteria)]MCK0089618.1 response regulator transcription factor [Rhodococcus sp. F64268]NLU62445.1 response regulator transcription factor [Rhodococcus sp. HNM0563]
MIRVVVVDDQTLVRQGIRSLLEVAEIDVVGEADDGRVALDVIADTGPDVVLLDLRMPGYDGIWTLDRLREREVAVPVLVLTTFDDDALVLDALRSGARGYLLKDVTLDQLTHAVRTLADGGTLIAPSITDRLLRAIRSGPSPSGAGASRAPDLTDRELEVLRLMAEGFSNRRISEALFLAEGTVKNHVSSILLKFGARDRTNAVLRALHDGVLR